MEKNDIRLMIGDVKFSVRAVGVLKKEIKYYFNKELVMNSWHYLEEQ